MSSIITWKVIDAAEPESQHDVMWASYVPFMAAAKTGKVHLTTPETYPRTLCGLLIPKPSKQFHSGPNDPRCTRCAKKGQS